MAREAALREGRGPLTRFCRQDREQASAHAGVPLSPLFSPFDRRSADEVHNQGEVWCMVLREVWANWETWFADIEESHTSLPALVFFRSPQADRSWITAAGAVLDAASLALAVVDIPDEPQAALCIRAGYLSLRKIGDFFSIPYNPNPARGEPVTWPRAISAGPPRPRTGRPIRMFWPASSGSPGARSPPSGRHRRPSGIRRSGISRVWPTPGQGAHFAVRSRKNERLAKVAGSAKLSVKTAVLGLFSGI